LWFALVRCLKLHDKWLVEVGALEISVLLYTEMGRLGKAVKAEAILQLIDLR
jgi:hypothetical protein